MATLVVAPALLPSTGCWAGQNSAASSEYARQVSTAQLRVAQLETQLVEAELRIEQLEEVLREQGKSEATRIENLDEFNAEITRLRGAIEVLSFESGEVKRAVGDQQLSQERRQLHDEMRLAQVESFLGVKAPPPPSDADLGIAEGSIGIGVPPIGTRDPPDPSGGEGGEDGEDGEDALPADMPVDAAGKLELAAHHMGAGRQKVARAILTAAISMHVGATEMAEVRYRHAETFFNEEDWRGAISEFNKVINNHPSSPWKCWSFFRQGEAFESMGQAEGAKAFYRGATEQDCKSSDAAKEAKKKL